MSRSRSPTTGNNSKLALSEPPNRTPAVLRRGYANGDCQVVVGVVGDCSTDRRREGPGEHDGWRERGR